MDASQKSQPSTLVADLNTLFHDLLSNSYPHVPNPPDCKKRASVALILRIRPTYPDRPPPGKVHAQNSTAKKLEAFFAQDWVQRGDPEVLFIKRAARRGDRFTSHVAFPGGRRDPGDASDEGAAVRETQEEVGLDLTHDTIPIGNLAERVVMSEWGKVPLMVLCPFIYLHTSPVLPTLQLQPSEVHGAHWVPLRVLLDPNLRTWERADVADRLPRIGGSLKKIIFRLLVGQMLYGATYLVPSASTFASEGHDFLPAAPPSQLSSSSLSARVLKSLTWNDHGDSPDPARPLRLWGLTHGIVADFLAVLPHQDARDMWMWPTFSALDVRLVTWLVSRSFRRTRMDSIHPDYTGHSDGKPLAILDEGCGTVDLKHTNDSASAAPTPVQRAVQAEVGRESAMWSLLKGYFQLIRRAVYITMALRIGTLGLVTALYLRRRRRLHDVH